MTPRWVIETREAEVLEVTVMYNLDAKTTEHPDEATSIVIALPNGKFWATEVLGPVHTVQ